MRARWIAMAVWVAALAGLAWWWPRGPVPHAVEPLQGLDADLAAAQAVDLEALSAERQSPEVARLLPGGLDAAAVAAGRARAELPTRPLILRTIDTRGAPLPGVALEFLGVRPGAGSREVLASGETRDVDGEALLVLRIPDETRHVRVATPGWWLFGLRMGGLMTGMSSGDDSSANVRTLLELPRVDELELVLAACLTQTLDVVDATDGRPVSSARVTLIADASGMPWPYVKDVQRRASTDAHGRARIGFGATGWAGLSVEVVAPGFAGHGPVLHALDPEDRVLHDVIRLQRAGDLIHATGVVSQAGLPQPGETLRVAVVEADTAFVRPVWAGNADDAGRFAFFAQRGADDERVIVGTSQRGTRSAWLGPFRWDDLDEAELRLELPPDSVDVTVRVLGARVGQRLAYGTAWALDGELYERGSTRYVNVTAATVEARVPLPARADVGVWVSPSWGTGERGAQAIVDGRAPPAVIELQLPPQYVLEGRVAIPSEEHPRSLSAGPLRTRVAPDGSFRLVGLPPGPVRLVLSEGVGAARELETRRLHRELTRWTVEVDGDLRGLLLDASNAEP